MLMTENNHIEKLKRDCAEFEEFLNAKSVTMTAPASESRIHAEPLVKLTQGLSLNARLFKGFFGCFRCEIADADLYLQWNPQIVLPVQDDELFRFYRGASSTEAFAVFRDGEIASIEEIDGDDGNVDIFTSLDEWLESHLERIRASYDCDFGVIPQRPWWKFW